MPSARPNTATLHLEKLPSASEPFRARQSQDSFFPFHNTRFTSKRATLTRDRKATTPLRSAPAEYAPTSRRTHSHAKPMCFPAVATIWLEGAFHLSRTPMGNSELLIIVAHNRPSQRTHPRFGPPKRSCYSRAGVDYRTITVAPKNELRVGLGCATVPSLRPRYAAPNQSFPQLWKKLWKVSGFCDPGLFLTLGDSGDGGGFLLYYTVLRFFSRFFTPRWAGPTVLCKSSDSSSAIAIRPGDLTRSLV